MATTAATATAVWTRAVDDLRPHPFNDRIYGDDGAADADLRASIRSLGVLVPLVVLPDGRIVSGHRRWGAARAEGLTEVPVTDYPGDPEDETEVMAAILEHNRQRVKTEEQRTREVTAMLEVEQERARRRMLHTDVTQDAPSDNGTGPSALDALGPSPQQNGKTGKASEVVGDLVGMSARQVEKAAAVIKMMDEMVAAGDYKAAEGLRQTLNKAGIGPAYKEVRKARGQPTGPIRPPTAAPVSVDPQKVDEAPAISGLAAEKERWYAEHKGYRRAIGPTPKAAYEGIVSLFPSWWVEELVLLLTETG